MEDQGKRILLFVVLAGLIFFAWQYLFPPEKSQPKPAIPGEAGQELPNPKHSNGRSPRADSPWRGRTAAS